MLFKVGDRIILHMNLLTFEISCFCFFFTFRRCIIAPPTNSENMESIQNIFT